MTEFERWRQEQLDKLDKEDPFKQTCDEYERQVDLALRKCFHLGKKFGMREVDRLSEPTEIYRMTEEEEQIFGSKYPLFCRSCKQRLRTVDAEHYNYCPWCGKAFKPRKGNRYYDWKQTDHRRDRQAYRA